PFNSFKEKVKGLFKKQTKFVVKESRSALRRFTTQYEIEGRSGYVRPDVVRLISANRMTKIKVILNCRMERTSILTGDVISEPASFHSHIEVNLEGTDVSYLYTTMTDRIMEAISNFQRQGSNWVFKDIISLEIHTVKYQPLRGNSYIPLPNKLESKTAFINMKNEDDVCFTWCVLRALNPVDKNSERIDKSLKGHKDLLNMNGIEYPVTLKAIDRFERENATISVNVFGYENKDVYPLRISKHDPYTCVNLLLIDAGEKQHYCLIKSMSRLLSAEWSKNGHKRHYCYRCLNSFNSEESLGKHKEYCDSNDAVKIEMLEEGSTLNFLHFFKSMRVPFIVYADFESFTQKLDTAQPNPDESYTKQYQKHTSSGFCYYIKCFDDEVYKMINLKQNPIIYTKQTEDEDISQIFFMASSLDKLVGNLQKDQFVNIKEYLRKKINKAEYNAAKYIVYRDIKELENPISNAIDIGEFDFLKDLID
ncbi:hypothetical protein MAR_035018, partial [Mya arenaria]